MQITTISILGTSLAAFGASTLAGGPAPTKYDAEANFTVTHAVSSTSTSTREVLIDGEPREGRGGGGGGEQTSEFEVTFSDKIMSVGPDGKPLKLERTYDTVSGSMSRERRGEPVEMTFESAFDGLKLELEKKDDKVEAKVLEGTAPDDERLGDMGMVLALDALLPTDELGDETSWEIAAEDFATALQATLPRRLLDAPERPDAGEQGGRGGRGGRGARGGGGVPSALGRYFGDTMNWEISAEIADATEEIDGVECLVIEIEAELSGSMEARGRGGRDRDRSAGPESLLAPLPQDNTVEGKLEGKLFWATGDAPRPVRFTIEGDFEEESSRSGDRNGSTFEMNSSTERSIEVETNIQIAN